MAPPEAGAKKAAFEVPDAFAQAFPEIGQSAGAENDDDDEKDEQELGRSDRAKQKHPSLLRGFILDPRESIRLDNSKILQSGGKVKETARRPALSSLPDFVQSAA